MVQSTIWSLPQAFEVIKRMNLDSEGDSDYRSSARKALVRILEDRMEERIDRYLLDMGRSLPDRRNGYFSRHLLTELGDIELSVPRTRRWSAVEVVRAYARRVDHIDRMILACFVLGISTRKVAYALMPVLGEAVSATTVSRVAKILDRAVEAFHRRPLTKSYRFLVLDGVVLKRRTGMGAVKRIVLVVLGITPDGKKEIIDFRIAHAESQAAWEMFLKDLSGRGLRGKGIELMITDGGKGLLAALPFVFSTIPLQRCWAHKIRNILKGVRKKDWATVKRDLHTICYAKGIRSAQSALKHFADKWKLLYPKAVASLKAHEEELLAFFHIKNPSLWSHIRTTNAIERRFREVKRRTRPMGVFSDRTSMERILYAVFAYENMKENTWTPFLA